MDELAHKLVPLLHTLKTVFQDCPRLPIYKNTPVPDDSTLPHCHIADVLEHREADLHLRWGLETARTAPFYRYPVPTRPHRFMLLTKLQASRIHQMRAGRSYLAAQPCPIRRVITLTCPRCYEEEETFNHAAIECPAHRSLRQALCPTLSSVAVHSDPWKSFED